MVTENNLQYIRVTPEQIKQALPAVFAEMAVEPIEFYSPDIANYININDPDMMAHTMYIVITILLHQSTSVGPDILKELILDHIRKGEVDGKE